MDKLKEMKAQTTTLSLIHTRENIEAILKAAEDTSSTYREFLGNILIKQNQNVLKKLASHIYGNWKILM